MDKQPGDKKASQKEHILEVAFGLFAKRGIAEVGVQEICDVAGITKPTLYYWFTSKDGLVQAVAEAVATPFLAELKRATVYTNDIILDTRRVVRMVFNWAGSKRSEYLWMVSGFFSPDDSQAAKVFAPYGVLQHQLYTEYFLAASEQHGNMKGKEAYLALAFPGVINGYIMSAGFLGERLGEAMVMQAAQHFLYGVFS